MILPTEYRLLRSVKNRFGPSNEIGVFQMESGGLDDVADPSMLFLSDKHVDGDEGDEVKYIMEKAHVFVVAIAAAAVAVSSVCWSFGAL